MWVTCMSVADVNKHWGRISTLLAPAIAKSDGEWEMVHVHQLIKDESLFVVAAGDDQSLEIKVVVVIHPTHYPAKTVCTFALVGGSGLRQLLGEHKQLFFDIARDFGCADVEIHGEGMARLLRQFGTARKVRTIMRAEV